MAVDLFSLVMNLQTTGTAQAKADLAAVESAGVRTASGLRSTTAAANQGTVAFAGLGTRTAQTSATLDRAASSALNGTKGFKDLSVQYAHQDALLAGLHPKTEDLRSRLAGLASTAIAVTAAFAVGAAVGRFLFSAAHAAVEGERSTQKLRIAVNDTGLSWTTYRDRMEGATAALARNTTFSSTDAKNALAVLVAGTHDAGRAQQLLTVAADLATFKQIGLEAAARILTQTLAGNARGMKEFGIETKDGTEAVAQLALLLRGQAAGAADTFDGKVKLLRNSWADFKESVGQFVVASGLGDFLRNSAREVETLTKWMERLNGVLGFSRTNVLGDRSTAELTRELADLRAAATGQAPGFLREAGLTGTVAPLTGDALTANQARQIEIQKELVAREQKRVLDERVANARRASEDEAHIKALADGLKLGTLTLAEDKERLAIITRLRMEMEGASLAERNRLKGLIDSLTPKVRSGFTAEQQRILGLANMDEAMRPAGSLPFQGIAGTPALKERVDVMGGLGAKGPVTQFTTMWDLVEREAQQRQRDLQRQFATIGTNLANTLGNAVAAAFTGKDPLKNFGKAVLAGLGSIFQQMGMAMIAASPLFIALNKAMMNPFTSGWALLALGVAMVALGATLGGIATGGAGGRGGAGDNFGDRSTQITLTAHGAGGLFAPVAATGPSIKVLGVNDPEGQRVFGQFRDNTSRRGI